MLGDEIWGFSLPPEDTCPGKSKVCIGCCYGKRGFYQMPSVDASLLRNFDLSRTPEFASAMVQEIREKAVRTCRPHVTGDYYGVRYTRSWIDIVKRSRRTQFYSYTRSWWKQPRLLPLLVELGRLPNFAMWFSWDASMPFPPKRKGIRTCYLSLDDNDLPSRMTDLVFRDNPQNPMKYDPVGNWVCPKENGVTTTTCSRCGVCWTKQVLNGTVNLRRRKRNGVEKSVHHEHALL
jgi:hypothetical protein